MGLELVVLYCVYAIVGGTVTHTTISVVGDIWTNSQTTQSQRYGDCLKNSQGTPETCKKNE
jgi:hypothetical protein